MKITKRQLEKLVESTIKEHYDKDEMYYFASPPPSGGRRKVPTKKVFEILALIPKMTPEQLEKVADAARSALKSKGL